MKFRRKPRRKENKWWVVSAIHNQTLNDEGFPMLLHIEMDSANKNELNQVVKSADTALVSVREDKPDTLAVFAFIDDKDAFKMYLSEDIYNLEQPEFMQAFCEGYGGYLSCGNTPDDWYEFLVALMDKNQGDFIECLSEACEYGFSISKHPNINWSECPV